MGIVYLFISCNDFDDLFWKHFRLVVAWSHRSGLAVMCFGLCCMSEQFDAFCDDEQFGAFANLRCMNERFDAFCDDERFVASCDVFGLCCMSEQLTLFVMSLDALYIINHVLLGDVRVLGA